MKLQKELFEKKSGFTIVELLTVMSVIAILIGLLVPALGLVKDFAKEVQQQSQFHSIEVGLGLYKTEFGQYPPSNDNSEDLVPPPDSTVYCGANKLAESIVGMDFLGFHPNADFRADGLNTVLDKDGNPMVAEIYNPGNDPTWQTAAENIQARKGEFVELENANAFRMDNVYDLATLTGAGFLENSLVLCDVYVSRRASATRQKTGMPILYYRARTNFTQQNWDDVPGGIEDDIYYYPDNFNLLDLETAETTPISHPLADGTTDEEDFENIILNRQITTIQRPYRAGSYILISAGKDGLYGTADDLQNFKKEIPF